MHVHVVQKGDTLWKISKQYGVSFDEVKRLNAHLANPDYVVPGMKIFVPDKPAKTQTTTTTDHPFNNDRPVKKNKEEFTIEPAPKPQTMPVPQAVPKPVAQPLPKPLPQPLPQPKPMPQPTYQQPPQPMPMPQPVPQPMPMPQPINQHLTMNQMMPPYMGVPYGWIPIPDMDVHLQVQLPPQAPVAAPKPEPKPEHKPAHKPAHKPEMKPTHPHGWQLLDSSSLCDDSSSLELPIYPAQHHQPQQQHMQPYHHQQSPCGCGKQNYAHQQPYPQNHYPAQTLGASQDNYSMMPQHMMMAPQMSPYMACTPCHMWPAPQGQWGYPNPARYY